MAHSVYSPLNSYFDIHWIMETSILNIDTSDWVIINLNDIYNVHDFFSTRFSGVWAGSCGVWDGDGGKRMRCMKTCCGSELTGEIDGVEGMGVVVGRCKVRGGSGSDEVKGADG